MFNPVSTYRIQFHKDFTFDHLEQIIPYLADLGIKTLYASPIFSAVPGSNHGYDGTDPLTINPEIGTLEQLKAISKKLKGFGMSWLQDIVPNHMAFHHNNHWLMDLLRNGPASPYRNYFDQSLADGSFFKGPIMVPFLGSSLDDVVEQGDLKVVHQDNEFWFAYADQLWPINEASTVDLDVSALETINHDKEKLKAIANQQYYRLCSWEETDNTINFRRFFTVNSLICINIQHKEVFDHYHQLIASLLKEDIIQGLRIDHIDGLYDPDQYLKRLRELAGPDTYIIAEKILEQGEQLPNWPIQGTTGYDFLAHVNNLFTNPDTEKTLTKFYQELTGDKQSVENQVPLKKNLILTTHMNGELNNLTNYFIELNLGKADDFKAIKEDIARLLVSFPVYRFYGNSWPLDPDEQKKLADIIEDIKATNLAPLINADSADENIVNFYRRCMQFSGPLMAKGVEDTLMYTYNRFVGHNEVGDSPDAFGLKVKDFHTLMQERQAKWPLALNATATHDTKHGEGARARLNVLSTIAAEWKAKVTEWRELNAPAIQDNQPDANDEYFIYQTLIGSYPMPGQPEDDFKQRLTDYLQKALREAKRFTNWTAPNEDYEKATIDFALSLLDADKLFWQSFTDFHKKVCRLGVVNSLAQLTLKLTCPGVPDIYQGCELWDLSMVDPDNRRPVDYELRRKCLGDKDTDLGELWETPFNGAIKARLAQSLLSLRASHSEVFAKGDYIPLELTGKHADDAIAFARVYNNEWIVTVVPTRAETDLKNTYVNFPATAPVAYINTLTDVKGVAGSELEISTILKDMPVAVLRLSNSDNKRSAGVLLHITSLPSKFGIGDFGTEARQFADLLSKSYQRCWQILPLNAVSATDSFSPYSAISSQAGNVMLISPALLVEEGLLTTTDLSVVETQISGFVDFDTAESIKQTLLDRAWDVYSNHPTEALKNEFDLFCSRECDWLDDYALYSVLKRIHDQAPWHSWPDVYKLREKNALTELIEHHSQELEKVKWLQFIFTKQWNNLKQYCNKQGIEILGDLPIYISYDSADVWAMPQLFELDENFDMVNVSGVPPDYFNEEGQRWGMPVYNWDKHKADGYNWWIKRISKNLDWYDLLRLDHFRAFAAYWAVPANEQTAINGKWVTAPGQDFFEKLSEAFPKLPLIAEDLGEIDDEVIELKDSYNLPGMKVLQFAFGDDIATSGHVPHHHQANYIVYTGTHDNNTTLGWFRQDADKVTAKNLKKYLGVDVNEKNIVKTMIRAAMASVCDRAVIPMQDWLELDETSRMNTPAGNGSNWTWQLTDEQLAEMPVKKMRKWTLQFDRV
ncbi:malto-oligosyltrehalose synthase [Mucilaginibacter pallidiroseus]|uniref:4-alpha-glucanotransferase n=1 Tax=Mucilaginibacter pallidiroseus TaxID=2599295 RepID=A0A563UJG8_9SPHI|nr:malto-oligosyltrehalose synthase [Mucilaginibacter pallidiroseus]TWR31530.1 malto-oligosyltrehalose synthase [Mucilaginibacter pallidiroseus]